MINLGAIIWLKILSVTMKYHNVNKYFVKKRIIQLNQKLIFFNKLSFELLESLKVEELSRTKIQIVENKTDD